MDDGGDARRYVRYVPRVPVSRDVVLAAVATGYGLAVTFGRVGDDTIYHGPRLTSAVFSVLVTGTLAWRRTRPLAALLWILVAWALPFTFVRHDLQLVGGFFVMILIVWSAGYHASRRAALACLATGLAVIAVLSPQEPQIGGTRAAIFDGAFVVVAWLSARGLRRREDRVAALASRLAYAQASYEVQQREILRAERARIARELHDIIAHSVSVILLQVGAARLRAPGRPDVTDPLHAAEASGRQALAELRRLLGVLNDSAASDGDGDQRVSEWTPDAPQPSIAALDRLAAAVRAAGLDVDLAVVGAARPLSPGLELSVYRIVQEALTNALKHASAARAQVLVAYGPEAVTIDVTDDGSGVSTGRPADAGQAGHGLIGIRQRVQVFGGTATAGRVPGGGWRVHAELPAAPAPVPDQATA